MRLSKLFIILFLFVIGYLVLISYPYFFSKINRFDSLGFLSLVEEKQANIQKTFSPQRRTDKFDNHLLKGEKIKAQFKSSENNFGILLVRFLQLSAKVSDTVVFRIKEQGETNWYYENEYKADQFQPNEYFTFGFPPIVNSKNKNYIFEIESLFGTYTNGIGLSPNKPQFALVYKYTRGDLKNYDVLTSFAFKKFVYVAGNINFLQNWQLLATLILPILIVLFIMKENQIKISRVARFFLMQLKIPLLVTIVFFLLQAFISFHRFGILSVVEEATLDFEKTDQQDIQLLENQKVSATFKATENNLGILLVKLVKFGSGSDQVVFRIKRGGEEKWLHESTFFGDQVRNDEYFPLGFPPITNSKNSVYVFEIESLAGNYTNGIGVIKEGKGALMYKYSAGELKNYKTLLTFVFKKFIYIIKGVNYWQVTIVFILTLFFTFLLKKHNSKLSNFKRFLPNFQINLEYTFMINKVKFGLHSLEKSLDRVLNKIDHWLTSSKIYLPFLDTNIKKRLIVGLLIFLFAILYRYSTALVSPEKFFYASLGGQGDYDQFIRAATCAVKSFCSYAILSQNFLFGSSILGIFYVIFGFIGGLKAYLYLMITLSSFIATLPYFLLSRKSWISVGGIIGSFFLATSDFLTTVSLNFPPDNGSTFTFSVFYIIYLWTLYRGSIGNLLLLGFWGTIDGLNKALFLLNNPVALALFTPAFFFEKAKKINKFPFFRFNARLLFYSALPFLVFLILYTGWEIFIDVKFSARYFLGLLIESGGKSYISYTSANDPSLQGDIVFKLFYLSSSAIVMTKRLIEYADLRVIFLIPIFVGLLYFSLIRKKFPIKKLIFMLFVSIATIVLLILIKNNYYKIHEIFAGEYIFSAWTETIYVEIFLFVQIVSLFILNFKYSTLKLSLPILPYVIMLIILTKNSPFPRISTQVVVWLIILLAFLLDWIMININKIRARVILGTLFLTLFIVVYAFPRMITMAIQLKSGLVANQHQVRYLMWTKESLPENVIILAGGKSDLVTLAENVKRPIVYSTLWNAALLIRPNEIPGVSPSDFNIVSELKNKDNFKKKKYIILEDDIYIWRSRIEGVADNLFSTSLTTLRAEDYTIKVYKYNPTLKKTIYELNLR